MRKFAFVVFNEEEQIIDKYNLDNVSEINGLGFSLRMSKIDTDLEDRITKVVQEKTQISFKITHTSYGYESNSALTLFLSKNIKNEFCLQYDNGVNTRYCGGLVTSNSFTEALQEGGALQTTITFTPTTPFFEKIDNTIRIQRGLKGKTYPYTYPYTYGGNLIVNNEIYNSYIIDIPIIITLFGAMTNPIITLHDENGEIYNEVRFKNLDLREGEQIIINSARKKIYFKNRNGEISDMYNKIDEAYDSYLLALPLTKSKVGINLKASDTGYLIGSRRQYQL